MKILKIHAKDFKSIEEIEINFEDIRGFWEIKGDVGVGKTTIGETLLFGLFGTVKDKNNADLIRWGKKRAWVDIDILTKNNQLLSINRIINKQGQCPVNVTINKEPLKFTNKRDAQRIIEEDYYDISRLTCELLCIISFNDFKSLSGLNTADTRDFLDSTFMLNILTDYANRCVAERDTVNREMADLLNVISNIESKIEHFEKWKDKDNVTQTQIEAIRETKDALTKRYNMETQAKDARVNQLNEVINKKSNELAQIAILGKNKKKEIELLSKGVCPVCGHKPETSLIEAYAAERERLLNEYKIVSDSIDILKKDRDQHVATLVNSLKNIKSQLDETTINLTKAEEAIIHKNSCVVEIDSLNRDLSENKLSVLTHEKDINEWDELYKFLYITMKRKLMTLIIPHINTHIQQFLHELGSNYTAIFDENFKCTLTVRGIPTPIPISSLSTGQTKVVDMAIILSILKVLLNSVNLNVIFLDELFSNMHQKLRNDMCTLLKDNIPHDKTIFVMSHAELPSDQLDGILGIDYIDGVSKHEFIKFN